MLAATAAPRFGAARVAILPSGRRCSFQISPWSGLSTGNCGRSRSTAAEFKNQMPLPRMPGSTQLNRRLVLMFDGACAWNVRMQKKPVNVGLRFHWPSCGRGGMEFEKSGSKNVVSKTKPPDSFGQAVHGIYAWTHKPFLRAVAGCKGASLHWLLYVLSVTVSKPACMFHNINKRCVVDLTSPWTSREVKEWKAGVIRTRLPSNERCRLYYYALVLYLEFCWMTSLKRQRHVLGVNAAHGNKVSRERIGHEFGYLYNPTRYTPSVWQFRPMVPSYKNGATHIDAAGRTQPWAASVSACSVRKCS